MDDSMLQHRLALPEDLAALSALNGGDQSPGRNAALLDPMKDAARVRAMYTHPAYVRRGVGRFVLSLCEDTARAEGFRRIELVATMAGEFYRACGYQPVESLVDNRGGVAVPLLRISSSLNPVHQQKR